MQKKEEGLAQKLMDKYHIVIDTFDDNFKFGLIMMTAATVILLSTPVVMLGANIVENERYENCLNSTVVYDDKEYQMGNMYIVYNADNVYFCTRNLEKVTDAKVTEEAGNDDVDAYYHRDEIYDYFDVRTGDKICSDHEAGFYIEGLSDFYSVSDMKEKNYQINLDEVSENVNIDSLLSRDPGIRR